MSTLAHTGSVAHARRNRRRNYVVRSGFQLRFAVSAGLVVFLASSIISSVLYGVVHEQARQRMMEPETYGAEVPFVVLGFASISYVVEKKSVVAFASLIIGLCSWIFYGMGIYRTGIAVPEIISSMAAVTWVMLSALRIYFDRAK